MSICNNDQPCTSNDVCLSDNPDYSQPRVNLLSHCNSTVLLSTAIIEVKGKHGKFHKVKAVLDSGSQSNCISSKCAHRLGLSLEKISASISGIAQKDSFSQQGVPCLVKPVNKISPHFNLDFIVIPKICSSLPEQSLPIHKFSQFSKLADSHSNISAPIDILLGADIFGSLITGKTISSGVERPVALETCFGWVIMDKVPSASHSNYTSSFFAATDISLETCVTRFWELEQVPDALPISLEDDSVETHFIEILQILGNGRFQVQLPFKSDLPSFNGSRDIVRHRFLSLERKLINNPDLKKEYNVFIIFKS
ncbi:uncharacterized protein [Leptinotarsa decemlineata]|uniref:uncharacterized protein n=1 Tax=Leptinotarsa decemlineata TaxID=7539 RepID=UPI003D30B00D